MKCEVGFTTCAEMQSSTSCFCSTDNMADAGMHTDGAAEENVL